MDPHCVQHPAVREPKPARTCSARNTLQSKSRSRHGPALRATPCSPRTEPRTNLQCAQHPAVQEPVPASIIGGMDLHSLRATPCSPRTEARANLQCAQHRADSAVEAPEARSRHGPAVRATLKEILQFGSRSRMKPSRSSAGRKLQSPVSERAPACTSVQRVQHSADCIPRTAAGMALHLCSTFQSRSRPSRPSSGASMNLPCVQNPGVHEPRPS